jgi:hypothetical protein
MSLDNILFWVIWAGEKSFTIVGGMLWRRNIMILTGHKCSYFLWLAISCGLLEVRIYTVLQYQCCTARHLLLVNPVEGMTGPLQDFTSFKPKSNFTFGIFHRVTTMANVSPNLQSHSWNRNKQKNWATKDDDEHESHLHSTYVPRCKSRLKKESHQYLWAIRCNDTPTKIVKQCPYDWPHIPRIVPGADSKGLVAPNIFRPVATASLPSQTMHTTGPLSWETRLLSRRRRTRRKRRRQYHDLATSDSLWTVNVPFRNVLSPPYKHTHMTRMNFAAYCSKTHLNI